VMDGWGVGECGDSDTGVWPSPASGYGLVGPVRGYY
jgi:hypothetical protein